MQGGVFVFMFGEKEKLLGDHELSDVVINAAQSLLQRQCPHLSGFQNTLLSQGLKFRPISNRRESAQILNTGKYYRVCMQWLS